MLFMSVISERSTLVSHDRRLIPGFILERLSQGELAGQLDAAAIFVDISGFTHLTESLMAHGHYGAETLALAVEGIFEPLIDTIFAHGGFVASFHGDAFTALFPAPAGGMETAAWRAVAAAWTMQAQMGVLSTQTTPFGEFRLAAKIGVAAGTAEWAILTAPDDPRAAYAFTGAAVTHCAQAENLATHSEIILTPVARQLLGDRVAVESRDDPIRFLDGHVRLTALLASPPAPMPPAATPASRAELARFLPATVLDLAQRGEFRQVIAAFVNLQGTPDLAALQRFSETIFALQRRYGGLCHRVTFDDKGCNLQLYWSAPTSQERDLDRALNFILDLRRECGLAIRAGITYRLAFAGFVGSSLYQEYTCYSRGVNLAARLMSAAGWGEIWLSDEVAQRADQQFQIESLGERQFKGFDASQAVHRLLAPAADRRPAFYRGRLAGREAELQRLASAIAPLFDGHFAGITTIVGEAGSGKSRLAHEFLTSLEAAGLARVLRGQTDDILRQPLNPFRYIVRHYFDQSPHKDPAANREQFERIIDDLIAATAGADLRAELERARSFLGGLVDLRWPDSLYEQVEPQLRAENTTEGLLALFAAESLRRPLVLLLEDTHYLDASSRAFLGRLARALQHHPIALLATCRQESDPDLFEPDTPQQTISLPALPESAVAAMAEALLDGPAPGHLARRLAVEAAGNPLFVEQLLLYLRNNGLLETYAEARAGARETAAYLPSDIRSLLVAQIDQLPPALRQTAQVASVLGREFDAAILAGMHPAPDELEGALALGSTIDIWYPLADRRYLFHHALLREVAYDMQLTSRRRELHRLAADSLTAAEGEETAVVAQVAEIAFHFDQAGLAERAVRFYGRAGELAAADYFNDQAIAYFDRALELAPPAMPEPRTALLLGREEVYGLQGRREQQLADLEALEVLAAQEPAASRWAEVYLRRAAYALATGDHNAAIALSERSAAQAVVAGDRLAELKAIHRLGRAYWQMGRSLDAEPHLRRALALAAEGGHALQRAECLYDLGTMFQYRGDFSRAYGHGLEAQEIFGSLNNRRGEILSLSLIGNTFYEVGDFVESREYLETALLKANEIGWRFAEATTLNNIGNALFELGDFDDAQHYFEKSVDLSRRTGDRTAESIALDSLGLVKHYQGYLDDALRHLETACELAQRIHNERSCGYSLTHLGFTLLELGQPDYAQAQFTRALAFRQRLGNEAAIMDTTAGLAAAEAARGEPAQAQNYAAQIITWIGQNGPDGLELPIQTYLICYDVLHRATGGDPAAEATAQIILADAHALLLRRAGRIKDDGLRRRFLEHGPFNRRLLEAWEAANSPTGS